MAARNRRRKNNPSSKPLEVNSKETKSILDSLSLLKNKVNSLNKLIDEMSQLNNKILQKKEVVAALEADFRTKSKVRASAKRTDTSRYVIDRVDFKEVDVLLDDIIDEELNSVLWSLTNLSMLAVMAASAYLWFKLNKAD